MNKPTAYPGIDSDVHSTGGDDNPTNNDNGAEEEGGQDDGAYEKTDEEEDDVMLGSLLPTMRATATMTLMTATMMRECFIPGVDSEFHNSTRSPKCVWAESCVGRSIRSR